jgi:hypothetical protein
MGLRFIKIAVVYLFIGASLGLGMGISQQFTLAPVHAHLLLLGWASFALVGLVYHLYPAAAETRSPDPFLVAQPGLARLHAGARNAFDGPRRRGPFVAISAIVSFWG